MQKHLQASPKLSLWLQVRNCETIEHRDTFWTSHLTPRLSSILSIMIPFEVLHPVKVALVPAALPPVSVLPSVIPAQEPIPFEALETTETRNSTIATLIERLPRISVIRDALLEGKKMEDAGEMSMTPAASWSVLRWVSVACQLYKHQIN